MFDERTTQCIAMKTKNELKNISKLELLELLAEQEREIEQLKQELQQKEQQLAQRTLRMQQAGNIAQAALALNDVFEAAQKAADQYVASIKEMYSGGEVKPDLQDTKKNDLQIQKKSVSTVAESVQSARSGIPFVKNSDAAVEEILQSINDLLRQEATSAENAQKIQTTGRQENKL